MAVLALAGCAGPPSHVARMWPRGGTGEPFLGLSTEDGVLVLAQPHWQVGDLFEIQFPVGNSYVRDWARLDRRNDDLAIVRPVSSRLLEGRFATSMPLDHEPLYLALRDEDDGPRMVEADRWHGLRHGNFIVPPEQDAPTLARRFAGAGLYVRRGERWEIVGLLADLWASIPGQAGDAGVGFVGIDEIARILPDQLDYFVHPILPPRPDFEHGVPLQPGDIVIDLPADAGAADGGDEPAGR